MRVSLKKCSRDTQCRGRLPSEGSSFVSKAHFILQSEGKFGRSGELEEGEVAFLQTSRSCMELAIGVFDRQQDGTRRKATDPSSFESSSPPPMWQSNADVMMSMAPCTLDRYEPVESSSPPPRMTADADAMSQCNQKHITGSIRARLEARHHLLLTI